MIDLLLDLLTAHPTAYRTATVLVGFLAAMTHTFRLITTWANVPRLTHAMGLIIGAWSFGTSLGTWRAITLHAPPNEFSLLFLTIQLAVIGVAVAWPRWMVYPPSLLTHISAPNRT